MRQKIIIADTADEIAAQCDAAMSWGWYVQSMTYGNGGWLAILTKAD